MTELSISIENVGGIDHMECSVEDSVAVITGPNSSNKTSVLQAIAFGLGRSTIPIKNDAEKASVELQIDDERVVRTARASKHGVKISGEGMLESAQSVELFDHFGCLLELNELRQAVRSGTDFESVLKDPMDLDRIERERAEKIQEKQRLQTKVEELSDVDEELDSRKAELESACDRADELASELDELRSRQAAKATENDDMASLREERANLVGRRNEYESQIASLEEAIEQLDERIDEIASEIESAREESKSYDLDQLENEREELAGEIDEVEDRLDVLQSVLTANREMLQSSYTGVLGLDSGLQEDTVACWACGNNALESDFEDTTQRLHELIKQDKQRRREYDPQVEELEEKISRAKRARQKVSELEEEKDQLETQRESRTESLETKREQLSTVRDELAEIDEELSNSEDLQQSELSGIQEETEQTQIELHSVRTEIDRLERTINDLREKRDVRRKSERRVEDLADEIADLTDLIENLETKLREGFNEAMDDLLSILDYERIERIWLDGNFNIVIAREVDGITRQDKIEHLSESEREMVGLVLALAGYTAYDVSDDVPVLILDALGAFDSERTTKLLGYFSERVPLIVTALLPDSADAVTKSEVDTQLIQTAEATASR